MALEGKTTSKKVAGNTTTTNTTGGSYGGGSGGSGGGGGGSSSPDVKELQNQIDVLGKNYDRDAGNLKKATKDTLDNINKQRNANAQQLLMKHNQINRKSDWQPNQQKEQSTYANLRRTMGNAAYGSGLADLNEGMARFDDMADVDLINTWKENQDNAYNNWYQANSDLISDYNDKVNESNQKFNSLYDEYINGLATVNAELAKKQLDVNQTKLAQNNTKVAALQKDVDAYANRAASASAYTSYSSALAAYKKAKGKTVTRTVNGNVQVKNKKGKWVTDKNLTAAYKKVNTTKTAYENALKKSHITAASKGKSYDLNTKAGLAAYTKLKANDIIKAATKNKNSALAKALTVIA